MQWLGSLWRCWFNAWLGNFHIPYTIMVCEAIKKKKRNHSQLVALQKQVAGKTGPTVSWLQQSSRPKTLVQKGRNETICPQLHSFSTLTSSPFLKKGYLEQNKTNRKEISIHFIFQFLSLLFLTSRRNTKYSNQNHQN